MYKNCNKCNIEKDINLFRKHRSVCKECMKDVRKLEYLKNRETIMERSKEYYKNNKEECKENGRKYYNEKNDESYKQKRKEYYELNKERIKEKRKEYLKNNKEKINENQRIYIKYRTENDELFKLSKNIRTLISNTFITYKFKKGSKTHEILGCSFEEFKLYLESKFEPWMNWNNRALYNGELNYGWDIDHITPISSAKTKEDIINLNHYTNFQPLCSYKNRVIKRNN